MRMTQLQLALVLALMITSVGCHIRAADAKKPPEKTLYDR
ncbi:MAG: hypothetical protein QOF78_2118, partial [Phycisphaerales bacterium]|nr:hypothetical protein [Phycisphaerales bacterium]